MRFLNFITGIFCAYIVGSKLLFLLSEETSGQLEAGKNATDFDGMARHLDLQFDYKASVVWCIAYFFVLLIWFWTLIKRKETAKIWIAAATLLLALLMNITDSVEHSIYISNVVVGTEILE